MIFKTRCCREPFFLLSSADKLLKYSAIVLASIPGKSSTIRSSSTFFIDDGVLGDVDKRDVCGVTGDVDTLDLEGASVLSA